MSITTPARLAAVTLAACSAGPEPNRCVEPGGAPLDRAFGDVGTLTGTTSASSIEQTYFFVATLPGGAMGQTYGYDRLDIRIRPGRGVFADGVSPGTYRIRDAETSADTCGLCVWVVFVQPTARGYPAPRAHHLADEGTVTLDAAPSPIAGSAVDLHFVETSNDYGLTGCEPTIDAVAFATAPN